MANVGPHSMSLHNISCSLVAPPACILTCRDPIACSNSGACELTPARCANCINRGRCIALGFCFDRLPNLTVKRREHAPENPSGGRVP